MKSSIGKKVLNVGITVLFILYNLTYPITSVYALPQESEIVSGDVNFERVNDTTLNIHASEGAIINYNSFNIAQNETVQFYMPDVNSFALNRVVGDGGTSIFGNLYANGNIILIDPNGILFGSTANVNVGGLIASTRDISNQNFLNGAYIFGSLDQIPTEFSQAANYGNIVTRDGGFAVLVGSSVVNEGTITAPLGTVALASGDMVTVGVSGDGFVSVGIDKEVSHQVFDAEGNPISDQIKNTGTLEAQGGRVLLNADAADGIFHQALNLEGVVKANHAEMQEGVVVITTSGSSEVNAEIEAGSITFDAQSGKEAHYDFNDSSLDILNDIQFSPNVTVNGGNANITVGGNWNNQGVFNGGNSTVEFKDAEQSSTIYGDNDFYHFRSVVPNKYIYFEAGKTQNILGTWKLEGAYAQHIRLLSTDPEAIWSVNPLGAREISYTWVEDSYNLNPEKIIMTESTNRDASYNWDPTGTWTNGAATGIWSDAGNWSGLGGATPGAGDDVLFNATSTADSSIDALFGGTINSLNIAAGYTGIITMNRSLTISTTYTQPAGTFSGNGQTLTVTGAYTLSGGTFNAGTGSTIDLNSSFTLSSGTFNSNSSDISIAGGFTISGTGVFNENTGSMTFDGGTATINVLTTETFNNLTFAPTTLGATKTVSASDTLVVNGTLTLTEGNVNQGTIPAPGTIQAKGDINQASTFDGGTARLDINGTGTQTFTGSATTTTGNLPDININKASGTLNLAGTIRTDGRGAGAWTYTAGTVNAGTSTVVWDGGMTVTGSHTLNNLTFSDAGTRTISAGTTITTTGTFTYTDGTIATGTINAQGDITQASTTDGGSGLLEITGTANQLFTGNATTSAGNLPDVLINKTGGTLTLSGTIRTQGSGADAWTYTAGTVDAITNDSTVVFAGANTITSTGMSFDNITFTASGTKTLGSNLDVDGNLTISGGTFTTSGSDFSINVAGNWTNTSNFTTNSSTITFDGTSGTQTLNSGGDSFFNLVHSGASTLQLVTNNLTVTGALTNSAGTFDGNGRTNTVTGLATISGGEYQASTATQTFNGGLTISGGTFTGSTGAVDINGNMTLSSGTLAAPTGTFSVSGNWDKTGGTFTPGSGTVTFDAAAGTQTLNSDGVSFNNLTHSGAGTLQIITNNLTVGGTLANSAGTFDMNGLTNTVTGLATMSGGTYQGLTALQTFNGGLTVSGTGIFSGSTGAVDVNGNVTISGGTLTASTGAFTVSGNWSRTGGTFTHNSGTVTFDLAAGTQTLNSGGQNFNNVLHSGAGTLQLLTNGITIGGTFVNSAGTFNANTETTTVTGLATISGGEYQASSAAQTFNGGLTISGGTFTGQTGTVDINGDMTLSSGTLTAPGAGETFTISGNWDKSGGTFDANGGTVTFDGTTILTSGGSSFDNITLGSTIAGGSVTTADNLDVNGALTVLNGGATTLNISDDTVNFAGNVTLTNLDTFTTTNSTVIFDGTTALTSAGLGFNNIVLGTTIGGASLTTNDAMDVNGTFTVLNGGATTFNISSDTVSFSDNVNLTNLDTFTVTSSTVAFDGTTSLTSAGQAFNNVQIGSSTAGGSLTTNDATDVNGTLTVLNGGATTFNISDDTVSFAGAVNLTNLDTFTNTNSTVVFDGTTALTSAGFGFNIVQLGSAIAGGTLTTSDALDINGTFAVLNGGTTTFNISDDTVSFSNNVDFTNLDTFTVTNSTVVFDGTTSLTSATRAFNNVQIGSSTAGGSLTTTDTMDINGTFSAANGGATTFDIDSDTVRFGGNVTLTDLDTFTVTGSTAIFDGTTALISAGFGFNNVQIGAAGSLTTNDNLDVNGTFDIATGTGTSSFNISDDTVNFAGNVDFTRLDTFTTTNSTVIFDGTTALTSAAESFNNVQLGTALTGASLTTNDAMNVNGAFTVLNGGATTFDITSDTVLFAGDVNLTNLDTFTVTGSTVTFDGITSLTSAGFGFNNVALGSSTAGGSLTTNDALDVNGTFTVNNGGATTWDISSDTINIAGTSSFSNLDTFTTTGSTVIFDGGTATITSIATLLFNAVTFDSTGTKTLSGTLAAGGLLTLTDGIINTGTLNAQGNVTVGAGFDGGSAPLSFTGTAAQSFDLTGAEALFNGNVTINKTSGTVTLLSDLTMDQAGQDLTVTSGELDLGARNLAVQDVLTIDGGTLTHGAGTIDVNDDLLISSGMLTRGTGLIDIADDMTVSGSGIVTASAGNITLSGGAGSTLIISGATASMSMGTGDLTAGDINQSDGTFSGGTGTITLSDDFTVSGGTFTSTSGTMFIADNFTHSGGTFTHNSGTVDLNGTGGQTISGSTTFNNLTSTTAVARTLTFVAGTTQTILGDMTLQGAAGTLLSLRSDTPGVQWNIDPQGTRTVSFLDVQDSNNINATAISCVNGCVDAGNNTNWVLAPPVPPVVNTGGVTSDDAILINQSETPLWDENWPWNVEFPSPSAVPATEDSFYTRPDIYYDSLSMRQRKEADAPMGFGAPAAGKKQEGVIICESLIFGGTACA